MDKRLEMLKIQNVKNSIAKLINNKLESNSPKDKIMQPIKEQIQKFQEVQHGSVAAGNSSMLTTVAQRTLASSATAAACKTLSTENGATDIVEATGIHLVHNRMNRISVLALLTLSYLPVPNILQLTQVIPTSIFLRDPLSTVSHLPPVIDYTPVMNMCKNAVLIQFKGKKSISLEEVIAYSKLGTSIDEIFQNIGNDLLELDLQEWKDLEGNKFEWNVKSEFIDEDENNNHYDHINRSIAWNSSRVVEILGFAAKYCKNLTLLKLPFRFYQIDRSDLEKIEKTFSNNISHWSKLNTLCFYYDDFAFLLDSVPKHQIKRIEIDGSDDYEDEYLEKIANTCPALEYFRSSGLLPGSASLKLLSEKCPNLRHFEIVNKIEDPCGKTTEGVVSIIQNCKSLSSLIYIGKNIEPASITLKALLDHPRDLEHLTLGVGTVEDRDLLRSFFSAYTNLKSFSDDYYVSHQLLPIYTDFVKSNNKLEYFSFCLGENFCSDKRAQLKEIDSKDWKNLLNFLKYCTTISAVIISVPYPYLNVSLGHEFLALKRQYPNLSFKKI